jgi:hypothetical protein
MVGYTTLNSYQIRMSVNDLNVSWIQLTVYVRDKYDCTTEFDLSSISIVPDINNIISLITIVESSDYNTVIRSNPLIEILYSGNQNDICQVLTSVGQVLNILAQQNLQLAVNSMFFFSQLKKIYFYFLKIIFQL